MSDEATDYDRKLNKTKKIMTFIVAPILLATAGLMLLYDTDQAFRERVDFFEEKPTYIEVVSQVDMKCYNVNWFKTFGFQVIYMESSKKIAEILDSHDMDFSNDDFFVDKQVVDYLVIECPHVDSRLEISDDFDPSIGLPALDKCLQVKEGFVESEDFCLQFKK